jgi:hypothetical protein
MKKILILLLICINIYAYSQDDEKSKISKLESFAELSGTLIKKEFIDIVKLKNLTVQLYNVTDLNKNIYIKGIKLSTTSYNRISGSTEHSSVLDADEIDGLIKSIEFSISVLNERPLSYTEYIYKSRDGLKFALFSNDKGEWTPVMQLNKYKSDSYIIFKTEELKPLAEIFKAAKNKL